MSDNKIEIRNLYKAFGKKKVLDGVDLDIKKGESLVVIGGSGTGKSVLIKCIQGLLTPDCGSIKIDDEETVGSKKDIHEKDTEYLKKSQSAARFCSEHDKWNVINCDDGEKPFTIEEIHEKIIKKVTEII